MTQWESEQSSSLVALKSRTLRKQKRQRQIDQHFNSIRKKMLKHYWQLEVQDLREKEAAVLDLMISQITANPQRSISKLWAYSLSFSFRYLTEHHIQALTVRLAAIQGEHRQQQLTMIVILIVNWASVTPVFTLDHSGLFRVLIALLRESRDAQLKQYILLGLSNFCCQRNNGIALVGLNAVQEAVAAIGGEIGQQDVCCFLSNLVQALPLEFHWDTNTLEPIIIFLKRTLQKAFHNAEVREDSISILKRLFLSQDRGTLIRCLQLEVKALIQALQNQIDCRVWSSVFQLLAIIYQKPLELSSPLFYPIFCSQIWSIAQQFLLAEDLSASSPEDQLCNDFTQNIWAFIDAFLIFPFQGRQHALLWLRKECLQSCREWQERALKLLVVALDGRLALELIESKLCLFQSLLEPTTTMLRVLLQMTKKRQVDMISKQGLKEALMTMKYDEREELAILANEIGQLWAEQSYSYTDRTNMRSITIKVQCRNKC